MEINKKVQQHQDICVELSNIYAAKNHDYGDSFAQLRQRQPNAILVRLFDKYLRLEALLTGDEAQVKDESIDDTLMDLANYCIMELVERGAKKEESTETKFDYAAFLRGEQVVNCRSEEDASVFLDWLADRGIMWGSGCSLRGKSFWEVREWRTCYRIDPAYGGLWQDAVTFYKDKGYIPVPFRRSMLEGI